MHSFPNVLCKQAAEPKKHTPTKKKKTELVFMHSFPMSSTNNLTRQRKKKANQSKQPNKQLNHHEAMGKKSNIGLNRLTCY
jgi:hypothetical protein